MKLNPKQLERAMKQMGVKTEEIPADEVIIKTPGKEIIISNPHVSKVNMMGQESFQIAGEVSERAPGPLEEDVKMVAEKTGATEEEARAVLEDTHDLAEAIMKLKDST